MSESVTPTALAPFLLRKGLKPGQKHLQKQLNCQDFADTRNVSSGGKTYYMGFIADGCSGENLKASHSEVIAKLLVEKALVETRLLLLSGTALDELNAPLFQRCASYVRDLAHLTYPGLTNETEFVQFVGNFLMCTLLGFITDGENTLVSLRSGDGVRIHNGEVAIVHDEAPNYIGYHALSPAQLASIQKKAPESFALEQHFAMEVFDMATLQEFALTTDGMCQGPKNAEFVATADVRGIFDNDPEMPIGLQWFLNKRANTCPFADDVAVVAFSRRM